MDNRVKNFFTFVFLCLMIGGCSADNYSGGYVSSKKDRDKDRVGRLSIDTFSDHLQGAVLSNKTNGVNSYLWKASLNAVHSMPILKIDALSGVIETDWHKFSSSQSDLAKISIFIVDEAIRANAVKVKIDFKSNNNLQKQRAQKLALEIEEEIITAARKLKGSFKS